VVITGILRQVCFKPFEKHIIGWVNVKSNKEMLLLNSELLPHEMDDWDILLDIGIQIHHKKKDNSDPPSVPDFSFQ